MTVVCQGCEEKVLEGHFEVLGFLRLDILHFLLLDYLYEIYVWSVVVCNNGYLEGNHGIDQK